MNEIAAVVLLAGSGAVPQAFSLAFLLGSNPGLIDRRRSPLSPI
jgi:hypothetical protein